MNQQANSQSSASQLPFVSVVMPVRNEGSFIEQSLNAVLDQDYPADRFEVIICDGMSTDNTRELISSIQKNHANVLLVDNPGQTAPKALNIAKQHCQGEIIARVDGHCVIAEDYIRRCVAHLRDGDVDGVGGPIETIGETPSANVIAAVMSSKYGVGGSAFRTGNTSTKTVDTIAFPVYTKAIIERAGPYDEQLVRNQDDEYNYRLRKMGAKLVLAGDVRSKYYSRSSIKRLARQYYQYGFWKVRVLQKHPRQMRSRQFAPLILVVSLLTFAVTSLFWQPAAWGLAGLVAAYGCALAVGTISAARSEHGWRVVLLPIVFATLHLSYGVGFLIGLFRFGSDWFREEQAEPVEHDGGSAISGSVGDV